MGKMPPPDVPCTSCRVAKPWIHQPNTSSSIKSGIYSPRGGAALRGAGAIVLRKEVCPSVRLSGRPGPKRGRKRGAARVKIPACSGWDMYKAAGHRRRWGQGGPVAAAPT